MAADDTGGAKPDTSGANKAANDPRYAKYFKLLGMVSDVILVVNWLSNYQAITYEKETYFSSV